MRYALMYSPAVKGKVHLAEDDDHRNAICGVPVSQAYRYSRRNVSALKDRKDCGNCLTINAARKRRAAR